MRKLLIPMAIVISGLIIAASVVFVNRDKAKEPSQEIALSAEEAGEKAVDFINENLLAEGVTVSLISTSEEKGLYKIHIKIGEEEYDSYITKDGELLFPQVISLKQGAEGSGQPASSPEVQKEERPDIKVFVMSYCPFGLQAQKMFLPVYNLFHQEADMGIYFVNYIMHGKEEIDENMRQYCIQKKEKEKYDNYLECFVKEGNFEECLSLSNIDTTKLTACIATTDQEYSIYSQYEDQSSWLNGKYPQFNIHSDLNEKYGVSGSPTIIINGQIVDIYPRSPENFKEIICQSFKSPPEECSQTLSNDVPSSGLGLEISSGDGGSCQ